MVHHLLLPSNHDKLIDPTPHESICTEYRLIGAVNQLMQSWINGAPGAP